MKSMIPMRSMIPTSRRRFLSRSLGIGAAVALGSTSRRDLAAAGERGSKVKLGLVTYLWGQDWKLPALIENCTRSKVLAVELRSTHAHGVEPTLSAGERKDVKKRFDDSPVLCLGPGSNERYDDPDATVLKKAIEATKGFVKLSHDIGGTGVKVKPDSFHEGVEPAKTIEQIGKSLNQLGKFAADYGQEIRLEVHGQCCFLPTIKQIMDVADDPRVVVCWNSNDQDLKGRGLEYNFDLVKKRFGKTAHVRELNVGTYPYQKLIDLFVAMDYDGWVCLECRTNPDDRIAALVGQRKIFERMVAQARKGAPR